MPNWIAAPVGNGSNCCSIGKGMRLLQQLNFISRTSHILGCQSAAANPLASSWAEDLLDMVGDGCGILPPILSRWMGRYKTIEVGETNATAARIGAPVSYEKVMREIILSNGVMTTAQEHDLNEAVAVCGLDGIFICPQTGIALAGIRNALRDGYIFKDETIVVVSTATGLKFTDSAVKNLQGNIIRANSTSTKEIAKILGLN